MAAGPGRVIALVLACAIGVWVAKKKPPLLEVVWWAAVALSLRCVFECVMDPYYLLPALSLAVIVAFKLSTTRLTLAVLATAFCTWLSYWHTGEWTYYSLVIGLLLLVLAFTWPGRSAQVFIPFAPRGFRSEHPRAGSLDGRVSIVKSPRDSHLASATHKPEREATSRHSSFEGLTKRRELTERDKSALFRGLWAIAGTATVFMALRLYMNFKGVVPETIMGEGGDFYSFLTAARQIATGHSPYSVALVHKGYGYVYSPFIALVLVPVRHLSVKLLWRSWTVLSIAALVVGGGFMARYGSPQLRRWHRPVFFAFLALTALDFGPTKWKLTTVRPTPSFCYC